MKYFIFTIFIFITFGCATVSDSVITAIDQEQYNQLNSIYEDIQNYRFNNTKESLDFAMSKLDSITIKEIYNMDFKAKVIGLKSLTFLYQNNRSAAKSLLKDLESITEDEELFWVVTALLEKDKKERLNILIEGKTTVYSVNRIDSFLADAYLENEMYGESTALYDSILLNEETFIEEYRNKRDLSFMFLQTPPSSYESGKIINRESIILKDLLELLELETSYLNNLNQDDIYISLLERDYFYKGVLKIEDPILRKDLAYFLFALIADRKSSDDLWIKYSEFFIDDISEDEKKELTGMSPILDTPIYTYYFYPTLYMIEKEIMELPDGENFFPETGLNGSQLHSIISSLKEKLN